MKFRIAFAVAAILMAGGVLFWTARSSGHASLRVATWSGDYGHAQMHAQMEPFAGASGADVRLAVYDGGTDELAKMVAQGRYDWDVVDMELPDAAAACRAGLLEPVSVDLPPSPNGAAALADFLPGAVGACWVANAVYSHVTAFDAARFAAKPPASLADVFDVKHYPGLRVLPAGPKYNLELALLADGVAPGRVYSLLGTEAGVARALAKLATLKSSLVFADAGESPAQALSGGRAAFALMPNGAVPAGAGIVWDRQLYEYDVLAIPHGTPQRKLAWDYVRYATSTPVLRTLAGWLPYGAPRLSAAHVPIAPGRNAANARLRPTEGRRMSSAFAVDDVWWLDHAAAVSAQWGKWLANR